MRTRLVSLVSVAVAGVSLVPAISIAGPTLVVFPDPSPGVGVPMHAIVQGPPVADLPRLHFAHGGSVAMPFHPDLNSTQIESVYGVLSGKLSDPATSHATWTALVDQDLAFIGQIYADAGILLPPLAADSPATHAVATMANAGRADGVSIPLDVFATAHETREYVSLTADRPAALSADAPCGALQDWLVEDVVGLLDPAPPATAPATGTVDGVRISLTAIDANGQITRLATAEPPNSVTGEAHVELQPTALGSLAWTAVPGSQGEVGSAEFELTLGVSTHLWTGWDAAMASAGELRIDLEWVDSDAFSTSFADDGTIADLGIQVVDDSGRASIVETTSLVSTTIAFDLARDPLSPRVTLVGTDPSGSATLHVEVDDASSGVARGAHALDWTHWWLHSDGVAACGTPYPSLEVAFADPASVQEAAIAGVYFEHLAASGALGQLRQHALDRNAEGQAVDAVAVQSILDAHAAPITLDYDLWTLGIDDVRAR